MHITTLNYNIYFALHPTDLKLQHLFHFTSYCHMASNEKNELPLLNPLNQMLCVTFDKYITIVD